MIYFFLNLPTFLLCLITVIVASGISVSALIYIRKKISWNTFKENHEVGGFLFNALGLIYAVLIAFVVIVSWEKYVNAQEYCDREANATLDIYLNSHGLPEQYRASIKTKILDYLNAVIYNDWPLLARNEQNPASRQKLFELWNIVLSIDSLKTEQEKIFYAETIVKLNEVTDNRRMRILHAESEVPGLIWTVLILGALTSVGLSLFFGSKSLRVQALMTSLFASTNAIILLMILALDYPFTGDIKISHHPYERVITTIQSYVF